LLQTNNTYSLKYQCALCYIQQERTTWRSWWRNPRRPSQTKISWLVRRVRTC